MTDFESVYGSVLGYLTPESRIPWVEDISREGTPYDRACQELWDAREHLCLRFGLDREDGDLERIMNAVLKLEKEAARGVFDAALVLAGQQSGEGSN